MRHSNNARRAREWTLQTQHRALRRRFSLLSGRCTVSTRVNQPNVNVALELSSREAVADGESTIEIQLFITEEDGETPFEGDVLIYTACGIGSLSNGLLRSTKGLVRSHGILAIVGPPFMPEVIAFSWRIETNQ